MNKKVVVVGAGLVGAVLARRYAEKGYEVEVFDRREHLAGNLYDYVDEYGVLVQAYGPHIFHTNSEEVYSYICKFSEWNEFKLVCGAVIDGTCTPTAFNLKTIDQFYPSEKAEELKAHIREQYGNQKQATVVELLENRDELIKEFAQFLFEKDYSLYTAKQWGIAPEEIDPSVLKRVPIRFTYEEAYFNDKYECMPENGYTVFVENILKHENITVSLGCDAKEHISFDRGKILWDKQEQLVVYTGPLDELFDCEYGRLPYRSLRFEWKHNEDDSYQEMPVVAYPQEPGYTRITEYKKLPKQNVSGTTIAVEYPIPYSNEDAVEPYYPVLTDASQKLYEIYKAQAENIQGLVLAGRLADFRYYNMDQAIEQALLCEI